MDGLSCLLVTGGCGAIGSEVINRLKAKYKNTHFVNMDALTYAGKKEHIEPPYDNYTFVYGNICDASFVSYVLDTYRPQAILHLAAETHVDNSFGNSFRFTQTNVYGTHVLLECVRKYIEKGAAFKMFLHMSTDEVYGSVRDDEPARLEDSFFSPSNPYSATKVGAEMICHAYQKSFNIPVVITRCNNAISKYQHEEKLVPRAALNLLRGVKVPIHGRGESKRTFIHAYDIADALDLIVQKGENGKVYNIGTDEEHTVLNTVATVLSMVHPGDDLENWVEYVEDRPFQDYRYSIDTSLLRSMGWKQSMSFEASIKEVVDRHAKLLSTE